MRTFILLIMAALAGMTCRAQECKPEGGVRTLTAGQHITPYRIGVPFSKTVHVLFPAEVRYVDLGSTDIIAGKADGVENVVRVKAAVRNSRARRTSRSLRATARSIHSSSPTRRSRKR